MTAPAINVIEGTTTPHVRRVAIGSTDGIDNTILVEQPTLEQAWREQVTRVTKKESYPLFGTHIREAIRVFRGK